MDIVSPFIQPLMSCIGPPLIRQFGYLLKAEENVDDLITRAGDLVAKKKDSVLIDAASRNAPHRTDEVKQWIKKVERIGGEVTIVQSGYNQMGRCWPNCWSSYKIGKRASKLLEKMTKLENERAGFDDFLKDAPAPAPVQPKFNASNVVGNMITLNQQTIFGYLKEETDEVIGIYGMGGVGKTTLLKAIHDNFLNNTGNSVTNKLFDIVIFIVVSKEHQRENLQKKIVNILNLPSRGDLDSQAGIIYQHLKEKNFLLLLDDVWEFVQLEDLGIPLPRNSSTSNNSNEIKFRRKVIFTTRNLQVCTHMKCRRDPIRVECLEPEEALDLLNKKVGEDIIGTSSISKYAKKVIKKCGGLPLAIVVIGGAMAKKKKPEEWDYALAMLQNSQLNKINIEKEEDNSMFQQLKFSYDRLKDEMRRCFLCCSLWPEDFKIKKEELIMCWMGLGLLDDVEDINTDINTAYDKGYSFIESLSNVSLLERIQDDDDVIKVHDVIRDLALWIACGMDKNKWLVKAGVELEEVPSKMVSMWGHAERVSLMKNAIKELSLNLPPCPDLLALLLQGNQKLTAIPGGFFTCMPNLTYLDLSDTKLGEIPKEICRLYQLRYLNLSATHISSLPEELRELKKLKYLLLRDAELSEPDRKKLITGIVGNLVSLEYLDLFPHLSVEVDELPCFPTSLIALGMKITSDHALQQLCSVVPAILHLNIEDMRDSTTTSVNLHLLLSSRTEPSLRELCFSKCSSISELVVDYLKRLESLKLDRLENLKEIVCSVKPPSECFERLRRLTIWGCIGLKDITWVLHLPCLEDLDLADCKEMEQLVVLGGGEEGGVALEEERKTFPRLRQLLLRNLPKLAMICDNAAAVDFPSLEGLRVNKCEELKIRLPFHPLLQNNLNCGKLKIIGGQGVVTRD